MHIPDNYLSPSTCAVMGAVMLPAWLLSINKVKSDVPKTRIPLLGIGAAFSFLIMMFNVPLPGGTTGHAVGGTLLAILLGPWAACISLTIALFIQALLFGDGGILVFGANCFNMALLLPFCGYAVYSLLRRYFPSEKSEYRAVAVGAYVGIIAAALAAAIEFGVQPVLFRNADGLPLYCPYPLSVSVPAMVIPHILVAGFVEAIFTVAIVAFIKKVSPGIIYSGMQDSSRPVYGLILLLVCLTPLGILAKATAWGEWGIDEIKDVTAGGKALGFVPEGMAKGFSFSSLLPEYAVKGIPEPAGYIISAAAGVAILLIVFKILSSFKKEKN